MPGFALHQPPGRELTGGDLLAQSLKSLGVEVIFGLHGGHLDAFLMGCEAIGIRLVDTRHETVAVQAAEGYSRASTKPAVCFVTANSGFVPYFLSSLQISSDDLIGFQTDFRA
jgi:glyoxylate carboligase